MPAQPSEVNMSDDLIEQATRWAAILNSSGDDDDVCDGQLLDALMDRIERLTAQLAEAREAERAAVVAWLRNRDEPGAEYLATWIEAGDHLT